MRKGEKSMDPLEKLMAFEEIRQLISRRTRLLDGKHWDELVNIYTDDVVAHHFGTKGGQALIDAVAKSLDGARSIHQVHLPEILLTSSTTARAIVPVEYLHLWEKEEIKRWAHGYGHYHQSFIKTGRGWLISDHKLTHQYLQEGYGDFDPSTGPGRLIERFPAPTERLPADFS